MDVHRKYGYDPAELFLDPKINFPLLKAARKLVAKKLGFRTHMDLIPLAPSLVKGSHGAIPSDERDWPILFGDGIKMKDGQMDATEVFDAIHSLFD